jgi:lipid-A-disaccharide synthase
LVEQLRRRRPDLEVVGIGGPRLRAAGMRVLVDTEHVATMGFTETFGTLGRLVAAYRTLVRRLDEARPTWSCWWTIRSSICAWRNRPSAAASGLLLHRAQVWAWRKGRIRTIAERVDKLAAVFPFEPGVYNNRNGQSLAEFVGHPLLDVVAATRNREETRARYGIAADRPLLALLPGSRKKEVDLLFRTMCDAAARLAPDGWQSIAALAESLAPADLEAALAGGAIPVPVAHNDTYNVVAAADAAIVGLRDGDRRDRPLGLPDGHRISCVPTHLLDRSPPGRRAWIGMPNIILKRQVFPELLQDDVTAAAIADAVRDVHRRHGEVVAAIAELRAALGTPGAASRAADLALTLIPDPQMNTNPNPRPRQ